MILSVCVWIKINDNLFYKKILGEIPIIDSQMPRKISSQSKIMKHTNDSEAC